MKWKINTFFLLFFVNFLLCCSNVNIKCGDKEYDSHVIIIKFRSNSNIYKLLRKTVPTSISSSLNTHDIQKLSPAIYKFYLKYSIKCIKALKPDADESPLAGGVERIFIVELRDTCVNFIISSFIKSKDIEYAELDYQGSVGSNLIKAFQNSCFIRDPLDPFFDYQWGLKNTGQFGGTPGADVNILPAWNVTIGDTETIVAILDSGMPTYNPEFYERTIAGYNFISDNNNTEDDYGHGTSIASLIGSIGNNGILMSGINWNCKLLPLKIFDSHGLGNFSKWALAIIYSVDHSAKIINLSGGGSNFSHVLQDAVNYAYNNNVIFVSSMMNNVQDRTNYPAGFSNVIAVGTINDHNQRWTYSGYGNHIDFVAPGTHIFVLDYFEPGYAYLNGTSASTAFVSGLISLMYSIKKNLNFQDIYSLIKAGAKDQIGSQHEDANGWDKYYGWGCIDAGKTISILEDTTIVYPIPENFYLSQNYPNPFNLNTTIEFKIPNDGFVNVSIYDVLGNKIITLINQNKKAGRYTLYWDAIGVSSNIYFYRLQTANFTLAKKMILIK